MSLQIAAGLDRDIYDPDVVEGQIMDKPDTESQQEGQQKYCQVSPVKFLELSRYPVTGHGLY